jgi:hypothetical protein
MNALLLHKYITIMSVGLFVLLASGCAVPGGGFYQTTSIGIGFYQPSGFYYGGWGRGYWVGPPRAGQFRSSRVFVRGRPTTVVRRVPSIPSRTLRTRSPGRFRFR